MANPFRQQNQEKRAIIKEKIDSILMELNKKDPDELTSLELYEKLGELESMKPEAERLGDLDVIEYIDAKKGELQNTINIRSAEKAKEIKSWKHFPKIK